MWTSGGNWLTCDVVGLYPCIPHHLSLTVLEQHLHRFGNYTPETNCFLLQAVEYLLKYNYFFFNGSNYLQKCGAPMGARFSPSLANIFMLG